MATSGETDRFYSRLLELCPVTAGHTRHLSSERGLSPEQVGGLSFGSLPGPWKERRQILEILEREQGRELMLRVPGIRLVRDKPAFAIRGSGLLIPHFDGSAMAALQVRLDDIPEKGSRYLWLSGNGSPSIQPLPYIYTPESPKPGRMLLTEGAFKALAAAERFGTQGMGLPGVATWRLALPFLKEARAKEVIIAFDADLAAKKHVFKATADAAKALRSQGYTVRLLLWHQGLYVEGETPKGVDDAISAGAEFRELAAEEVPAYLAKVAEALGVAPSSEPNQAGHDPRPTVRITKGNLFAQKLALAEKLAETEPPLFYEKDGALVTPRPDKLIHPSAGHLRSELDQSYRFVTVKKGDDEEPREVPMYPPGFLVEALRDTPAYLGVPRLRDFTMSPVALPDGSITRAAGYYAEHATFYTGRFECGNVPDNPTEAEVKAAVELLLQPLQDFPFVSEADRTNALGLMLAISGRAVVPGLVPAFMISASTPGTGKGLLAEIVCRVATGQPVSTGAWKSDSEEFRKSVTTSLMEGARIVCYDNVNDEMDSGNFAAIVTARTWTDRQLGANSSVHLENRTIFLATANNPSMSAEVQRRFVTAELATTMENPGDRSNFKIEPLAAWVEDHQVRLLAALLTLWRAWFVAGAPLWRERKLGSFEEFCETVGGVLAVAGVSGFLANKERVRAEADSETSEWRSFVGEWWRLYGERPVTSTQLQLICHHDDLKDLYTNKRAEPLLLSVLGSGNERSQQSRLGRRLNGMRNRIFGIYQIRKSEASRANTLYYLEPTKLPSEFHLTSGTSPQSPQVHNSTEKGLSGAGNGPVDLVWTSQKSPQKSTVEYPTVYQDLPGLDDLEALSGEMEAEEREARRSSSGDPI